MRTLLPVQRQAINAAHGKEGFGFLMEMGLGKTLAVLAEFHELLSQGKVSRLLVVCPNSFKGGWAKEVQKHGLNFMIHIYNADRHQRAERWLENGFTAPPLLIINYDALRLQKVKELIADYCVNRKVYLAADESIALKNPQAKRTKSLLQMALLFRFKRILSGKPTTQGAHDLWAQLRLIDAMPMPYYPFRNAFCEMGGFEGREVVGIKDEERLKRMMEPYIYRATKKQWLPSLPDKSYTTREYALSPQLARHYGDMELAFITWVDDIFTDKAKPVMVELALTKYAKMSQIHAGFIHDEGGVPQWLCPDNENPRLQALLDILAETDSKVCVCYKHRFVGEQLKRVLSLKGLVPALIEGGMETDQIEDEKDFFNTNPRCRVMLLQLDASKYGHTLVGSPADACYTMIFYENTFSLDTRSQVEDRIHRQGQENACLYIDLAGTEMDLRVVEALQNKEQIYLKLFGDTKTPAGTSPGSGGLPAPPPQPPPSPPRPRPLARRAP